MAVVALQAGRQAQAALQVRLPVGVKCSSAGQPAALHGQLSARRLLAAIGRVSTWQQAPVGDASNASVAPASCQGQACMQVRLLLGGTWGCLCRPQLPG